MNSSCDDLCQTNRTNSQQTQSCLLIFFFFLADATRIVQPAQRALQEGAEESHEFLRHTPTGRILNRFSKDMDECKESSSLLMIERRKMKRVIKLFVRIRFKWTNFKYYLLYANLKFNQAATDFPSLIFVVEVPEHSHRSFSD